MLRPSDRRHLLDSLRPPSSYQLDCAIGTTFSLDLMTLLTVPLAFAFFNWDNDEGRPEIEPLAILEALRGHADRIHIFCQSGGISIPKSSQQLYSYLEESVFQVAAPDPSGVFHPKIWVLRFTKLQQPVLYRILCLSRNLTFDRSWDTALVLEGELIERTNAFSANHPLGDFIKALPELSRPPVPERVVANIDRIQDELRRVQFNLPDGFDKIDFWPLGIQGYKRWPFSGRLDRMMVVSPFISEGCLRRLTQHTQKNILVSRLDELEDQDSSSFNNYAQIFFMNPAADVEDSNADEDNEGDTSLLNGLHAKLYVADSGWYARVWTGSANATDAAYNNNVEFLVELVGKRSRCGIDALMSQEKGVTSFIDLLQKFTPSVQPVTPDPLQVEIKRALDAIWRNVSSAQLVARVFPYNDTLYSVQLCTPEEHLFTIPSDMSVKCWPITLQDSAAVKLSATSSLIATFENISFEALTSFFAFELKVVKDNRSSSRRFVLNLPLEGAPTNRRARILRSLLNNSSQFVRLLLYILADGGIEAQELTRILRESSSSGSNAKSNTIYIPLFESLVRALNSNLEKLDRIARLVEELRNTPEGKQLLPEGFDEIWDPIWAARQGASI